MTTRYELKPQPFFPPAIVIGLAVAPLGYLIPWLRDVRAGEPPLPGLLFGLGVYAVIVALIAAIRYLTWSRDGQVIRLEPDALTLPLSASSRRMRRVAHEDLLSVSTIGAGPGARLLIGSRARTFLYAAKQFAGGAPALDDLRQRLRETIAQLPGGMDQLAAMDERETLAARLLRTTPRVTLAILAVLAGFYLWTVVAGALDPQFRLVRFGANVPSLIERGEWYRLFSANFLHAGLLHLYLNGLGIFVLGSLLERLLGAWRYVCVYLVSAVAGALASTWAALALLSVGASTAVFGLLGSLAVLNWRFRAVLPGGFSQPLRWWVLILGINALLPVIAPMIDYWAHIGGFAAGALATSVMCPDEQCLRPPHTPTAWMRIATSTLVLLCVLSLGEAVSRQRAGAEAELAVAREFIEQDGMGPIELNAFAWEYATTTDVTREELAIALEAAERAVDLEPNEAIIDTLATVQYRQGNYDGAAATQARAIARSERRDLVSQMGRFLAAQLERGGVLYPAGGQGAIGSITIEADRGARAIATVELTRAGERGFEVYALDQTAQGLRGTLRLVLGAGVEPGMHSVPTLLRFGDVPSGTTLTIAYVDATDCRCGARELRAVYYAMDPEISQLP